MAHILTVSGSPRQQSRSARLLDHVAAELAVSGHHIEHLKLLDLPAEALLTAELLRRAADADAGEESVWVDLDGLSPAEIRLLLGLLASDE